MHENHPAAAPSFKPFAFACKARDLTAQLEALKQNPKGLLPCHDDMAHHLPHHLAQDVDAAAPHYAQGLSRAVL
jgi:hypothetical protein